jgi:GxxExxY protein
MSQHGSKSHIQPIPETLDRIARQVVDATHAVHRALGPGLLESVYEVCLLHELAKRGLKGERQVAVPLVYDGVRLDAELRLDLVVENGLLVELKAVETILAVHHAQVVTYLERSGLRLGLLMNFNVPVIRDGIKGIAL